MNIDHDLLGTPGCHGDYGDDGSVWPVSVFWDPPELQPPLDQTNTLLAFLVVKGTINEKEAASLTPLTADCLKREVDAWAVAAGVDPVVSESAASL